MSILTGFKKVKNYILTSSGYQLLSRWTSSQTVEFDDGKTAQSKLGEINGIAKTYVDMKKATDNSMAASAKAVMEGLENSSALISMTQAEYDALSDEERTDNNMRAILDANPDVVDAKNVNFDNTDTNLTATNTQSAITELNGNLPKEWKLISTVTTLSAIGSGKGLTIPDLSSYKELLILTTLSYFETSETYPIINGHINGTGYARPGCYLGSSNWQTCTIYISDAEINVVDCVKNGTAQTSGFFVTFYIR
jgi:hypothetical protein